MAEDTVTISRKEYNSLRRSALLLEAYECAGVDNWTGCEYVYPEYRELLKTAGLDEDD